MCEPCAAPSSATFTRSNRRRTEEENEKKKRKKARRELVSVAITGEEVLCDSTGSEVEMGKRVTESAGRKDREKRRLGGCRI